MTLMTRALLVLGLAFLVPLSAASAQRPSASDARAMMAARPELIAQLRERILSSGLSPQQVRARLQAEGYPPNLLDAYLSDRPAGESAQEPDDATFSAVRALGIMDEGAIDSLRPRRGARAMGRDTSTASRPPEPDSVLKRYARMQGITVDSLLRLEAVPDSIRRRIEAYRGEWRRYRAPVDSGFHVFGRDLFDSENSLFDPNVSGPVDAGYRLGPGDRLVLILTGDVEAAYTLDVTREGFVVVPSVGQLQVANLTLGQLEDLLYARLGRVYSGLRRGAGATVRFSISVARLRSNQVYVVGDVEQPGSYRVSSAGTVMSALYAAGGPSENGSFRRVELRRGGRAIGALDLYDYLLRGNSSSDLRLETGDVVFVPPRQGRVRIWGEVIRPATYELKPGETLRDLLAAAGGFTGLADRRRVQIERVVGSDPAAPTGAGRAVMDVAAPDLENSNGAVVPMQAGDVVRVFRVPDQVVNRVTVVGNVWSPGAIGFHPGLRLSEALRLVGGPRPDSYLAQVLVTRLRPDSARVQLRSALRDTTGNVTNDLELADGDRIEVFSRAAFRADRYVVISGAVKQSGRYPYRQGMTLRDLVLLAGGLEESALLSEAELARMPESRAAGVTAQTVRVPLDSSYLLERGPGGEYPGPPGLQVPSRHAPDVILEPYDNVLIFRQPDWSLPRTAVITGEVVRPGRYTLERKSERLSDLVERAGGLTRDAYADGISFVRREKDLGRIGVDLPKALHEAGSRENLLLVDGDSINIPVYSPVVNVRGAVHSPVAVPYVRGRDIDYYVEAAGGPTQRADDGRAYVTQPNGKVESKRRRGFVQSKPRPQPGSTVMVPEKEATSGRELGAMVALTAQVLAALATLVAVLK